MKKDMLAKVYFRDPSRFADLCNYMIFDGKPVVSALNLMKEENELLDEDGQSPAMKQEKPIRRTIVDMARQIVIDGKPFAYVYLEHQSSVDYAMALRGARTTIHGLWNQFQEARKKHKQCRDLLSGAEYLSGMKAEEVFLPVYVLVVYFGNEPWNGKRKLSDLFVNQSLSDFPYKADLQYGLRVLDYHEMDNFEAFKSDLGLLLKALSVKDNKTELIELLKRNESMIDVDLFRLLGELIHLKGVNKYIEVAGDGKEVVHMCKALEDLREEGIMIGEKRGEKRGEERLAQAILDARSGKDKKALREMGYSASTVKLALSLA